MKRNYHCFPVSLNGFTLIELIMTMVIVGIISVVAAPRFLDTNVFRDRGTADQVRAALRYGQKVAIAQRRDVTVTISSAPTSACDTTLTGGNVSCVIDDKVVVVPGLPRTYTFNGLGQPGAANLITVGATAINITAETGYVR